MIGRSVFLASVATLALTMGGAAAVEPTPDLVAPTHVENGAGSMTLQEHPAEPAVAEPSVSAPSVAPADEVAAAIKRVLRGQAGGTASFKKQILTALEAAYAERAFAPLWVEDGRFNSAAQRLMERIERAADDGLEPKDYALPKLKAAADAASSADERALAEFGLSAAALAYAQHAQSGRVDPLKVSPLVTMKPERVDLAEAMKRIAAGPDAVAVLESFHPTHEGFRRLRDALAELRRAPTDPLAGASLTPGQRDPNVALLRKRLQAPAGADPMVYDVALEKRVKKYQTSRKLEANGVVTGEMLAALEAGTRSGVDDVIVNMERWRWMPRELGAKHILVNVPEYLVRVSVNGATSYTGRVVVGTRENQTPIFSDEMQHIVVNPYWNVPSSILIKEMMPSIRRDPGSLTRRGYEVVSAKGKVIDPYSIDWSRVGPETPVRIRQEPGEANALGKIKFLFPNEHAVYLHDTPSRDLFMRETRAFSHGCIRVHEPLKFADAILGGEPNITSGKISALVGGDEKWLNLTNRFPVHIAYFTTVVGEDGVLAHKNDIYGHDATLAGLLGLSVPPETQTATAAPKVAPPTQVAGAETVPLRAPAAAPRTAKVEKPSAAPQRIVATRTRPVYVDQYGRPVRVDPYGRPAPVAVLSQRRAPAGPSDFFRSLFGQPSAHMSGEGLLSR